MMSDKLSFLEGRLPDLKGRRQLQTLDEIAADFENIRVAWEWMLDQGQYDVPDRVIEALWLCMILGGHQIVVRPLWEKAYQQLKPSASETPHPLWTKIVPRYAYFSRNFEEVEQVLHLARQRDDRAETAFCLMVLGQLKRGQREFEMSLAYLQESLAHYQALGDQFHEAQVLGYIGACHQFAGDQLQSIDYARQSLELSRQIGDVKGADDQSRRIGISLLIIGNYEEAEQLLLESQNRTSTFLAFLKLVQGRIDDAAVEAEQQLRLAVEIGDYDGEQLARIVLAMLSNLKGDYIDAKQQVETTQWTRAAQLFANWVLAVAACGLGEFASARQYIVSGVNGAATFNSPVWQSMFLAPLAVVLANEGQLEKAAQIMGLVFAHPASATGWLRHWTLLVHTSEHLKDNMDEELFAMADATGRNLKLEVALSY